MSSPGRVVQAVTCFLLKDNEVLLQKRPEDKVWSGMLNGPGGKIEAHESSLQAVVREVKEETGLTIHDPQHRGMVSLSIPYPQPARVDVDIYLVESFSGQECPNEGTLTWYPVDNLPLGELWKDQKYWLPAVLDGFSVEASVQYQNPTLDVAALALKIKN